MESSTARRAREDEKAERFDEMEREESRRRMEASYADLPALPPPLPPPDYLDGGATLYKSDEASRAFYAACAQGNMQLVRDFIRDEKPSDLDLQYALEEASHGFQATVVRYLMGEHNVNLHVGCIHKDKKDTIREGPPNDRPAPPNLQVIFDRDSPELLELLRAFIDHGWHPNQLVGPMQHVKIGHLIGLQEVALHFPRCLREMPILRLLLDSGADPTIARYTRYVDGFDFNFPEAPTRRKTPDILHMALNVGTRETVDLLLSRGARLEYGAPIHSLVTRASQDLKFDETFETPVDSPDRLVARCDMADYLLGQGENINGLGNVYFFTHNYCATRVPEYYAATPLSHALGSRDWEFARWLMERGADPDADRRELNRDELVYGFYDGHNNQDPVQAWIKGVRLKKIGEVRIEALGLC